MLYALVAHDKADGFEARTAARPDHLKHLEALGDTLVLAGPYLDEQGRMTGSIMVVEAETQAEAEALFAKDPFMVQGVFERYDIRPWKLSINKTAGR